jgi:hypothetical protein
VTRTKLAFRSELESLSGSTPDVLGVELLAGEDHDEKADVISERECRHEECETS